MRGDKIGNDWDLRRKDLEGSGMKTYLAYERFLFLDLNTGFFDKRQEKKNKKRVDELGLKYIRRKSFMEVRHRLLIGIGPSRPGRQLKHLSSGPVRNSHYVVYK